MNVEIRTRGFPITPGLQANVERRLAFALDRHEDRIGHVKVTLGDVNGPKGGPDKLCRVEAHVRGGRTVHVSVVDADAYAAIAVAARRTGRAVARAIERERATVVELVSLSGSGTPPSVA